MQSSNMKTLSKQNVTMLSLEENERTNTHIANVTQLAQHMIRVS